MSDEVDMHPYATQRKRDPFRSTMPHPVFASPGSMPIATVICLPNAAIQLLYYKQLFDYSAAFAYGKP
jgi:hypothetical protein